MALPSSRNKGLSRFYTAHMLWIRMGRVLILCTRGVCNAFMCSSAWLTNWLMDWLAVAGLTYSCGARGRLSGWFIGVLGECRSCVWPWRERGRASNGLAHSGIAEQWETAAVLPGVEHFLSHCLPWTLTDRTQSAMPGYTQAFATTIQNCSHKHTLSRTHAKPQNFWSIWEILFSKPQY